jgi:hypothetical protein
MRRLLVSTVTLLLCTLGSAFGHSSGPFNAEELSAIKEAKVFVIVPPDKIWIAVKSAHIGGQQFGLIGDVIDGIDFEIAGKKTRKIVGPLHDATPDLDFRRDFFASLKASGLFDAAKLELVERPLKNDKEVKELISSANGPVVLLLATPTLSGTSQTFLIDASLALFKQGGKKPIHEASVSYQSKPVVLSRAFLITSLAMPRWIDDQARAFRSAYEEGMRSTTELLAMTLQPLPTLSDQVQERMDWSGGGVRRGKLVRDTPERTILFDGGTWISIANIPTFESLKLRERIPRSSAARVYFYRIGIRDTFFIDPSIFVNGSKIGELFHSSFSYVDLPAGKYTFTVKYDGDAPGGGLAKSQLETVAPVQLDVQSHGQYFIRYDGYKGIWTKDDILKNIDAEPALSELGPLFFSSFIL